MEQTCVDEGPARYCLTLGSPEHPALIVLDRWTGIEHLRCRGDIARYALAQLGLSAAATTRPVYVDKSTVRELALRVTAARLRQRPAETHVPCAADRLLLGLLRDCRGVHFTTDSAKLLLGFHGLERSADELDAAMERLADKGLLARIDVGTKTFFDTDTEPHWHVFDEAACELLDLDLTGDPVVDRHLVGALRGASARGLRVVRSGPA